MKPKFLFALSAFWLGVPLSVHAEIYSCTYSSNLSAPISIEYDTTNQRFALIDFMGKNTLDPEIVVSEFSARGGQLHFNFDEYYEGYVEYRRAFSFDFDQQAFWQTNFTYNPDGSVLGHMSIPEQGECVASSGQTPIAEAATTLDICAFDSLQTDVFLSRRKCVSSALGQVGDFTFGPESLFYSENMFAHAWCDGGPSNGIGEQISLYYEDNNLAAYGSIGITNGFSIDSGSFDEFSRVKSLRVEVDGGQSWEFELADSAEPQILALRGHINSNTITFTILDVYRGSLYDDVCISDIEAIFDGF